MSLIRSPCGHSLRQHANAVRRAHAVPIVAALPLFGMRLLQRVYISSSRMAAFGAAWHPEDAAARRLPAHGHVFTQREAAALQVCSLDEFATMVRRVRDNSIGPDRLLYNAWGATVGGIASVYRVPMDLTFGGQPPAWFNAALVIFIPKGVSAGDAYAATEAEFRPLTLAVTALKFVAKAVDGMLSEVASGSAPTVQRGFVAPCFGVSFAIRARWKSFCSTLGSQSACPSSTPLPLPPRCRMDGC